MFAFEGNDICENADEKGVLGVDNVFGLDYLEVKAFYRTGYFVINVTNPTSYDAEVSYTHINFSNSLENYYLEEMQDGVVPIYEKVCEPYFDGNMTVENCEEQIVGYKEGYVATPEEHTHTLKSGETRTIKMNGRFKNSAYDVHVKIDIIPHFTYFDGEQNVKLSQEEWALIESTSDDLIVWIDCNDDLNDNAEGVNQGGANNFVNEGGMTFDVGGKGTDEKYCLVDSTAENGIYTDLDVVLQTADEYTVCLWVNHSADATSSYSGFSENNDGGIDFFWRDDGSGPGTIRVRHGWDYAPGDDWSWGTSHNLNTVMNHICITYKGSTTNGTGCWNGVCGEGDAGMAAPGTLTNQTISLTHLLTSNAWGDYSDMNFDEYLIFNVTLDPIDIKDLYDNGGVPNIVPTAPSCTSADTNITVDEDTGNWELDDDMGAANNITCTDANADTIYYTITTQTSGAGTFSIVSDALKFATSVNQSGVDYVTINVSDGITGDVNVDVNVTVDAVNDAPSCFVADTNITVNEDSGVWDLDANMSEVLNISCVDLADGDALGYSINVQSGDGGTFSLVDDLLRFTTDANESGTSLVTIDVTDGTATINVDAKVDVNSVNDNPWWDEIVNGSSTKIKTGLGYQPIDVNASLYFRDVEDDQTPDNITISVNETGVDCSMPSTANGNFSIFCDPDSVSVFIITLVGEDSGTNTATTSFEELVIYPPSSPTISLPVATTYHGNITLGWAAGVSPQGDEIAYYNLTINDTSELYYEIGLMNATSYSWDTRELVDFSGYYFQVEVCDNNSLCNSAASPVFNINNTPHWDEIGNSTAQNIKVNFGKQPVLNNVSQYFRDFFDDQTPTSLVVSDNETRIVCSIETNLSLFCTPTIFEGDYIITFNGTNSVANSSFESFEGFVENEPPSIPNIISPPDRHLNDTETLNLSCGGSTDVDNDIIVYDYWNTTSTGGEPNKICNNVDNECLWNNTEFTNQIVYWTCNSNDTWENSTLTSTRSIRTETWDLIDLNESFFAEGGLFTEGERTYFEINASRNEIRYTNSIATLNFSNVSYTTTRTAYDNYTNFRTNINLPAVSEAQTFAWTWIVNFTKKDRTIYSNNSYSGSLTVNPLRVYSNCSVGNTSDTLILNISFWDEFDMKELDFFWKDAENNTDRVEFDYSMSFYKSNPAINQTIQGFLKNITSFGVCIPIDEEYTSIADIEYWKLGTDHRHHYFIKKVFDNVTDDIRLFLLDIESTSFEEGTSIITPTVQACDGNYLDGYLIFSKYDNENLTNPIMEMGYCDGSRGSTVHLQKGYTPYSVNFKKVDGTPITLQNSEKPNTINADTPQYREECTIDDWRAYNDFYTQLSWDVDSFKLGTEIPAGKEVRFLVQKIEPDFVTVCDDIISSSTTSYCNLSSEGFINDDAEYKATVMAFNFDGNYTKVINVLNHKIWDLTEQTTRLLIGDDGIIAVYLLTSTLALGGTAIHPVIGLVLLAVTVIGSVFMKFFYVSYYAIVIICFMIGFAVYNIKKRGGFY